MREIRIIETTEEHANLVNRGYRLMNFEPITDKKEFMGGLRKTFRKRPIESVAFKQQEIGSDAYIRWEGRR